MPASIPTICASCSATSTCAAGSQIKYCAMPATLTGSYVNARNRGLSACIILPSSTSASTSSMVAFLISKGHLLCDCRDHDGQRHVLAHTHLPFLVPRRLDVDCRHACDEPRRRAHRLVGSLRELAQTLESRRLEAMRGYVSQDAHLVEVRYSARVRARSEEHTSGLQSLENN